MQYVSRLPRGYEKAQAFGIMVLWRQRPDLVLVR